MKRNNEKINEVYTYTVNFIDTYGYPPSVREICAKCSIKSTATAYSYLEKLNSQGLLIKSPLKKRAISVPSLKNDNISVPLIGNITAGSPILAVENLEGYVPLPADFNCTGADFALKVRGESMINAGIKNNDIIIVKKQNFADNGEIVVALIEDSATIKRFYKKEDHVVLHPENDTMEDMIFPSVEILGIVKGLIRKF